MSGLFLLLKAYRETAIQPTQIKKFFITHSSVESTDFFTIFYIYPYKGGKCTALREEENPKTQIQQLQLLSTLLRIQLLI